MATRSLSEFFSSLTRRMALETLADQSDPQLVARALAGPDEAALQAIVHRHGAMVYRVCWRVLHHVHDAEDAFQATFLVLAQKLRSVRKQASLASWLHGVAHRVALKARTQAAARRRHESQAAAGQETPPEDGSGKELLALLDAELERLPEKWRLPLILCYLEGRTQDEAAGQLGWSKTTLRNRLDEARAALGRRLTRRGFVFPAVLSTVLLSDCMTPAAGMVATTVVGAVAVASGKPVAAASAKAAALAKGMVHVMLLSNWRTMLAGLVVLAASLIPVGEALLKGQTAAGQHARAREGEAGAVDRKAAPAPNAAEGKPARDIAVIAQAQLYEVDDAFFKKLAQAKRLSKQDLEELERQFLGLSQPKSPATREDDSLFKLLEKHKPILTGKEIMVDNGRQGTLLSWHKVINCLPSPEQVRKGDKVPQKVEEGVSVLVDVRVSWDRRFVRVKFTEKSTELEGIDKVRVFVGETEKEVVAEVPFLKEATHSQVRYMADGGSFLLPIHYRPRDSRDKQRLLVLLITARIWIEEEERIIRQGLLPTLPGPAAR